MSDTLAPLDAAFDEESWQFLNELDDPGIAIAVENSVKAGAKPEEIRNRIMQRMGTHRRPIALRCEAAARHLISHRQLVQQR